MPIVHLEKEFSISPDGKTVLHIPANHDFEVSDKVYHRLVELGVINGKPAKDTKSKDKSKS